MGTCPGSESMARLPQAGILPKVISYPVFVTLRMNADNAQILTQLLR